MLIEVQGRKSEINTPREIVPEITQTTIIPTIRGTHLRAPLRISLTLCCKGNRYLKALTKHLRAELLDQRRFKF